MRDRDTHSYRHCQKERGRETGLKYKKEENRKKTWLFHRSPTDPGDARSLVPGPGSVARSEVWCPKRPVT